MCTFDEASVKVGSLSRQDVADVKEGLRFLSIAIIAARLGYQNGSIDILKMDYKGCEWNVLSDLITLSSLASLAARICMIFTELRVIFDGSASEAEKDGILRLRVEGGLEFLPNYL